MGAMVMGLPYSDTVIVNHALLYLPLNKPLKPVSQGMHLDSIRAMMLRGEYDRASRFVVDLSRKEGYGAKRWTDPFIPAFQLVIDMKKDSLKEYSRSVNFRTGEAGVKWQDDAGEFNRSTFVSRKDNLIITRILSDSAAINCGISLQKRHTNGWWEGIDKRSSSGINPESVSVSENTLTYHADFENKWEGMIKGYEGGTMVFNKNGQLVSDGKSIKVTGASEILLITWVDPVFEGGKDINQQRISDIKTNLKDYDGYLKDHVAIHGDLFDRVSLRLDGDRGITEKPVEEIIRTVEGNPDPALVELSFNAARYNIISAAGVNPPNLQGIWSGTLTVLIS